MGDAEEGVGAALKQFLIAGLARSDARGEGSLSLQ